MSNYYGNQMGDRNVQYNTTRLSGKMIAVILFVVSLMLLAGVFAFSYLTPDRAVATEKALQDSRDAADRSIAPVEVSDVEGPTRRAASTVLYESIDLNGALDGAWISDIENAGVTKLGANTTDGMNDADQLTRVEDPVYFKLTGMHNEPVRISSVAARVITRNAPPAGTIIAGYPQGVTPVVEAGIDLDDGDLVEAKLIRDYKWTDLDFAKEQSVTLAKNETIPFKLTVKAGQCDCFFVIEITYADGSFTKIDSNGEPFRMIGLSKTYGQAFTHRARKEGGSVLRPCIWPMGCAESFMSTDGE